MTSSTREKDSLLSRIGDANEDWSISKALKPPSILLIPYSIILLFFFIAPILVMIIYSFSTNQLNLDITKLTLGNYVELVNDNLFHVILVDTVRLSATTTIIAFVISYPAAYGMARKINRGEFVLIALMLMPLFTSVNIRVYGWFLMLIDGGVLTGLTNFLGFQNLPSMIYQEWTVLLGMTYVYLPFMLFPIYISFANLDESLLEAASDLGASRFQAFRTITFPNSIPGILIGSAFTFILSLGAHVEGTVLGGNTVLTLATELQHSFGFAQNWATGSAQGMLMLLVSLGAAAFILNQIDFAELSGRN